MSINETEGVVVEETGVLEKFEGALIPENVVERIYVRNGEIVKQEWLENGEVVRTETVKEVD